MSRVKNIGGQRYVTLLDREVADGETVDVPDKQPDGSPIAWPEDTWQPVTAKAPAKTDTSEKAAS